MKQPIKNPGVRTTYNYVLAAALAKVAPAILTQLQATQDKLEPVLVEVRGIKELIPGIVEEVSLIRKTIPPILDELAEARGSLPPILEETAQIRESIPPILNEAAKYRSYLQTGWLYQFLTQSIGDGFTQINSGPCSNSRIDKA